MIPVRRYCSQWTLNTCIGQVGDIFLARTRDAITRPDKVLICLRPKTWSDLVSQPSQPLICLSQHCIFFLFSMQRNLIVVGIRWRKNMCCRLLLQLRLLVSIPMVGKGYLCLHGEVREIMKSTAIDDWFRRKTYSLCLQIINKRQEQIA